MKKRKSNWNIQFLLVRVMKYVKNIAESISNFQGDFFDFFAWHHSSHLNYELKISSMNLMSLTKDGFR